MTEKEQKELTEGIGVHVKELQETIKGVVEKQKSYDETVKKLDAEDQAKLDALQKGLETLDKLNEDAVAKKSVLENEKRELEEQEKEKEARIKNLEGLISKGAINPEEVKANKTQEFKAFHQAITRETGRDAVDAELKSYLRTDVGQFGGFLVPEAWAQELLKQATDISRVRSVARVRTTRTKTLNIPIRTTLPTASYEGEAESTPTSKPNYISETMTAHRQHTIIPITRDMLNYSDFNMETEISSDAMVAFAQGEGLNFISGDGVKKPQGILTRAGDGTNNTIQEIQAATGGTVTLADVINLPGNMKEAYSNPLYFFNRKTLNALRTEVGTNGQFVWTFGGERFPTVINGLNYMIMQDMPDIANDSLSVGVGDFFLGYNILDSIEMELIRDDVTRKEQAIVEFSWNRYNDGRVVLAEAFKLLDTAS